jgi:D-alanyl-D-alanine dipeptidase
VRVTVGSRGVSADRREGDNTTPLGTFLPGLATGYSATPPTGTALEYRRATETLKCVDDPSSRYYNRIVDERSVTKDWTSAEDMRRKDSAYSRVIELKYNTDPAVPGKGSCIFLHVWKNAETGTAGCVAMSSEDMETLLAWIERDTKVTVEVGD